MKHILIFDGTLSRLQRGHETHAGKLFKFALSLPARERRLYYDCGVQGLSGLKWLNILTGMECKQSIIMAYWRLSRRYQKGDEIFLFGYSRGAVNARILAAMIDEIGLLRKDMATYARAQRAFRLFNFNKNTVYKSSERKLQFWHNYCHDDVEIHFIGAWDSVGRLGLPWFGQRVFMPINNIQHIHILPKTVKNAAQALARDESLTLYQPIFWTSKSPGSRCVQRIFPGNHAIIGGHVGENPELRLLSNLSFQWLIKEANRSGLGLSEEYLKTMPSDPKISIDFKNFSLSWQARLLQYLPHSPRVFTPEQLFENDESLAEYDRNFANNPPERLSENADDFAQV